MHLLNKIGRRSSTYGKQGALHWPVHCPTHTCSRLIVPEFGSGVEFLALARPRAPLLGDLRAALALPTPAAPGTQARNCRPGAADWQAGAASCGRNCRRLACVCVCVFAGRHRAARGARGGERGPTAAAWRRRGTANRIRRIGRARGGGVLARRRGRGRVSEWMNELIELIDCFVGGSILPIATNGGHGYTHSGTQARTHARIR